MFQSDHLRAFSPHIPDCGNTDQKDLHRRLVPNVWVDNHVDRAIDIGAAEQLCYIPCDFCNIVLAVSVPCANLFDIVTIRCGHCCNLWSVNMAAAFQSLSWQDFQAPKQDYRMIDQLVGSSSNGNGARTGIRQPAPPSRILRGGP
ncbi:hypothetical protein MLD38_017071 [Melastoma candidum]|uniref:Uncharacterized protein n=2 Tax=Melastoma candidum TaxID=119954 RepID=A0ACB9M990_9MYRT|nr:hypothetical protein MLD38_040464 [Melastoma candidum]KAI4320571.1 hypothetical protein MLD38_034037 [Melastoma candidum]KAI4368523.1 hypothetical protein MLD38_017071 [Melastoma candidum]